MPEQIPSWSSKSPASSRVPSWASAAAPNEVPPPQNETDAQWLHRMGTPEPGYTYLKALPFKRNNATGERSFTSVGPVVRGLGDLLDMAANRSIEMTPDGVSGMLGLAGATGVAGAAAEKIATNTAPRMGFWGNNSSDPMLPPRPTFNPAAAHGEISSGYGAALNGASPFYSYMDKTAQGKYIDGGGMLPSVKSMIADIEADPFHEGRAALSRLRALADQIEKNPNIPLSDAVGMKQEINTNFNPKRFTQGSKTPYFEFGELLDSKLKDAATQYPDFGKAKQLADQYWVNNVTKPFTENSVLQKFWKPDDYYAKKSVDRGISDGLPDATRQRAANMAGAIEDPVELDAVTKPMSPETSDLFRKAVYKNVTNGSGGNRLESAGKTVYNLANFAPADAAKSAFKTLAGPEFTQAQKELLAATKLPSPSLNKDYAKQLGELMAKPPETPLMLTYQPETPMGYQSIPEPSAPIEMLGGYNVLPKPATQQEMLAAEMGRQNRADMGMYPKGGSGENIAPAQAAAAQGQSPMLAQYGEAKMMGNENLPPPMEPPANPGALGNAEIANAQRLAGAKKMADIMQGNKALDAAKQITPEQVQDIFNNRLAVGGITGNQPTNTAIQDALLSAFRRSGK